MPRFVLNTVFFSVAAFLSFETIACGATADPLTPLYSNTLTVRSTLTNDTSTILFAPNHTLLLTVIRNGRPLRISGLWTIGADNSSVCVQPSPLGAVAIPLTARCLPLVGHMAGDHWTALDDSNHSIDLTLSAPQ
jgi:hypothetical protein